MGVSLGLGSAWPLALAPLLSLRAGWPLQPSPRPMSEAHPGPQALPEQQDMSCPTCPWKEAAYQRGKDALFRLGHLPGLRALVQAWQAEQGAPCSQIPVNGSG